MRSRCKCGRVKSKHSSQCTRCHKQEREQRLAESRAVVASGKCPQCNSALRRNSAIAGWWQCEQYGAEGFRKDSSKPSCSFQTFTE